MQFPTLSRGQDSAYFKVTQADPSMRTPTEGGYVYTRPRFTRRPRRTFVTGFTNISEADRALLEQFWNDTRGGSLAFDWTHPISGEVISVRFAHQKPLEFEYAGIGHWRRWNCGPIELEEV